MEVRVSHAIFSKVTEKRSHHFPSVEKKVIGILIFLILLKLLIYNFKYKSFFFDEMKKIKKEVRVSYTKFSYETENQTCHFQSVGGKVMTDFKCLI